MVCYGDKGSIWYPFIQYKETKKKTKALTLQEKSNQFFKVNYKDDHLLNNPASQKPNYCSFNKFLYSIH